MTLTHSAAGVVAGHAAGLAVVAVGVGDDAEMLSGLGAHGVVPVVSDAPRPTTALALTD